MGRGTLQRLPELVKKSLQRQGLILFSHNNTHCLPGSEFYLKTQGGGKSDHESPSKIYLEIVRIYYSQHPVSESGYTTKSVRYLVISRGYGVDSIVLSSPVFFKDDLMTNTHIQNFHALSRSFYPGKAGLSLSPYHLCGRDIPEGLSWGLLVIYP